MKFKFARRQTGIDRLYHGEFSIANDDVSGSNPAKICVHTMASRTCVVRRAFLVTNPHSFRKPDFAGATRQDGRIGGMTASLQNSLSKLAGSSVRVSPGNGFPEDGHASADLLFEDGTRLQIEYWRLIEGGRASYSSFDHQQIYGLPVRIDAVRELHDRLAGKHVVEALHDQETGDLQFTFTEQTRLQVLNVTGYEIWTLQFPDGRVEYSNYAK